MAQLVGLIVSEDDGFKKHFGRLLRAGAIPVSVIDDRAGRDRTPPDLVIVDTRGAAASRSRGSASDRPSSSISSLALARWRCFSASARVSACWTPSTIFTGSTASS